MRLGLNAWAFSDRVPLCRKIQCAASVGYDGLEVNLTKHGEISMETENSRLKEYHRMAEDSGICIHSVCSALYWEYSLTSSSSIRRSCARDVLKRQIEVAANLNAAHILCVPGAVGVDLPLEQMFEEWHPISGDVRDEVVDYSVACERAKEALIWAGKLGRAANVTIGIENVGNKFLLSPLEMAAFIDSIESEHVKAYFDVGNVYKIGYPEHWIRALNGRLDMIHLKDYDTTSQRFVALGKGSTDLTAVRQALEDCSYDGWLTFEHMGWMENTMTTIVDSFQHMKGLFREEIRP